MGSHGPRIDHIINPNLFREEVKNENRVSFEFVVFAVSGG